MARVLVAPDKFKGSLTAPQVVDSLITGMRAVDRAVDAVAIPVAVGGEGTLSAALSAGFVPVQVVASGPTGRPVRTMYARREAVAVIETADVSGLAQLPGGRARPLTASSRGTGEVLAAALDAGCTSIVLGIGGKRLYRRRCRARPGTGGEGPRRARQAAARRRCPLGSRQHG